jgi:hypothetical protein
MWQIEWFLDKFQPNQVIAEVIQIIFIISVDD